MSTWGKVLGAVSITTGVLGAAALGGATVQRRTVKRLHTSAAGDVDPDRAYDALAADRTYSVVGDDGVALHVEEVGPEDAPLTLIFSHGWTLRSGAWHYQRIGLAGPDFGAAAVDGGAAGKRGPAAVPAARMVFYDQRSHGRSSRATSDTSTFDYLASDLAAVIATAAPDGPLVIIGHSMGGMALLTLAGRSPELFAERVIGVGLVSTSASHLPMPGLSRTLMSTSSPLFKLVTVATSRFPRLIERGRAGSKDAVWLLTRSIGFARRDVPGDLVDYLDEMISGTSIEVIADFAPALVNLDEGAALPALADIPTAIICGVDDRMTPPPRSEFMAQALPRAELVLIPGAGHMAIMEAPEEVNGALRRMLVRAAAYGGLTGARRSVRR